MGIEKTVEHESDGDTNIDWCTWYSHQRIDTGIEGLRNNKARGDNENKSFIKINQNTKESSGDLRRLAATQTPEISHWLTLVWKTRKANVGYVMIETNRQSYNNWMQQITTKREWDLTWLGGQGDPLGIVQEIYIWPYEQVVYAQPRIRPGKRDAQSSLGFWDTNESPNLGQTTRPWNNQQHKKIKRENMPNCGLYRTGRPQDENKRKWKER